MSRSYVIRIAMFIIPDFTFISITIAVHIYDRDILCGLVLCIYLYDLAYNGILEIRRLDNNPKVELFILLQFRLYDNASL